MRSSLSGFSLLEVLAALSVLALSLLVLLQTDGLNAKRTLHTNRLIGAMSLATERMEELFASESSDLFSENGQQDDNIYSWERTVSDTEYEGLKEVRLTISWYEGSREESYVVLAYLPR